MNNRPNTSEQAHDGIDSEARMEQFKHKLEIRRLLLDKLILALVLVSFAFLANRLLESYKNDLSLVRFHQEKRLAAVVEIKEMFSDLSNTTHDMIIGNSRIDTDVVMAKCNVARKTMSKWSFYFSRHEIDQLSACLWNYEGLTKMPYDKWAEYDDYLGTVDRNIRLICRSAIGLQPDTKYFEYIGITATNVGVKQFLADNYARWQNYREEKKQ